MARIISNFDRSAATSGLTFEFQGASQVTTLVGDGATVTGVEWFSIVGGSGNDIFTAGDGLDSLTGNEGNDTLSGGRGDDYLYGGEDDDTLSGGLGRDYLGGDEGTNTLYGGGGDDQLDSHGLDTIDGGGGGDRAYIDRSSATTALTFVMTDTASVTTVVGDGTTVVNVENIDFTAGNGNDDIETLDGSDSLYGGEGSDTLSAGGGDDYLKGGLGDDTLFGGAGNDLVDYSDSANGVTVDLAAGTAAGDGSDTLDGIENVYATNYADVMRGNSAANDLDGGYGGGDRLFGGNGKDILDPAAITPGSTAVTAPTRRSFLSRSRPATSPLTLPAPTR